MENKCCSICLSKIESDDAPILTVGAYGTPRYLCHECIADIECATLGKEYDKIIDAMDRIAHYVSERSIDDSVTVNTVTELLEYSARRAKEIREGTYDFSLDDTESEEVLEEIPEELLETEEDKLLDKADEERANRFDKILNWVWVALIVGAVAVFLWLMLNR